MVIASFEMTFFSLYHSHAAIARRIRKLFGFHQPHAPTPQKIYIFRVKIRK